MRKEPIIAIADEISRLLLAQAAAAHPHECCGLLLGCDGRVESIAPAANAHPQPARHFEIDPAALIAAHRAARRGGPQIIGYYHSHPAGPATPSPTDRAMAARDGKVWAIVGHGGDVTFWRDDETGFTPLAVESLHG